MKKEKSTSKIPPAGRLSVVYFPVEKIKKYSKNARTHSAEQVAQIAASISEFGFTNPLLIDEAGSLIAGHGRLEAALSLGMADVPTIMLTGLSENQRRAYVLADNKIALNAGWDEELLHAELESLRDLDFNLELLGWDEDELSEIFDAEPAGQSTENLTPSIPTNPTSAPGDLWILGDHRLLCGDSTDQEAVAVLMDGCKADMVFTDPPYGVAYVGKTKDALKIQNDALDEGKLKDFIRAAFMAGEAVCAAGAVWYVTAPAGPLHHVFATVLKDMGVWRQTLNWVKNTFALGRSDFHYRHEPIFYGWLPNGSHFFSGDRTLDTVWEFDKPSRNAEHPTMKPVALVERAIVNSSQTGQVVLDLFGGSGSTLIACEKTDRKARLMELDPIYVDVIVQRWENFTGRKAHEDATGLTFEEKSKK